MSVIVRDISKRMGKNVVLRNVSIEVDPGTVVGLQGINRRRDLNRWSKARS